MKKLIAVMALLIIVLLSTGCSMGPMVVRTTATILDGGVDAMNRETDLELARSAIPAQLKLLEGLIIEDPGNSTLRVYAAQALHGYAFAFVEMDDRARAGDLYRRGMQHGLTALKLAGMEIDPRSSTPERLRQIVDKAGNKDVGALFWTASAWAKWIDMNRDSPESLSQISNPAVLMQRVLELDETYYYGSPHIFFGVYYGARAPMFGGDYKKSADHFAKARRITGNRLLLTDVMQAEYLSRQQLDQASFHSKLTRVINAPKGQLPEMALANAIARERARRLLALESDWF